MSSFEKRNTSIQERLNLMHVEFLGWSFFSILCSFGLAKTIDFFQRDPLAFPAVLIGVLIVLAGILEESV